MPLPTKDKHVNVKEVADCLREYGEALRGSWGDIDGRSERAALHQLAEAIENPTLYSMDAMRNTLDVCPLGLGHWQEFCDSECAEVSA
jgi:hypothetical protein